MKTFLVAWKCNLFNILYFSNNLNRITIYKDAILLCWFSKVLVAVYDDKHNAAEYNIRIFLLNYWYKIQIFNDCKCKHISSDKWWNMFDET